MQKERENTEFSHSRSIILFSVMILTLASYSKYQSFGSISTFALLVVALSYKKTFKLKRKKARQTYFYFVEIRASLWNLQENFVRLHFVSTSSKIITTQSDSAKEPGKLSSQCKQLCVCVCIHSWFSCPLSKVL